MGAKDVIPDIGNSTVIYLDASCTPMNSFQWTLTDEISSIFAGFILFKRSGTYHADTQSVKACDINAAVKSPAAAAKRFT